jgi:hypothetical protein
MIDGVATLRAYINRRGEEDRAGNILYAGEAHGALDDLAARCEEAERERDKQAHLHGLDHSLADQWLARAEAAEADAARLRESLLAVCRTKFSEGQTPFQVEQMFHLIANAALSATKEPA